jgi:hypothetical protein
MRYQMMAVLALATAACGGGNKDAAKADSLARDLAMAPADSTASAMNDKPATTTTTTTTTTKPTPRPAPTPSRLTDGTSIGGASMDSLNSRTDHVGKTIRMTVASAVKDAQGRTVIPAGAVVTLRVDVLGPGAPAEILSGGALQPAAQSSGRSRRGRPSRPRHAPP